MDSLKREVDRNYDWFQRNLRRYIADHRGRYALLKSADLVEFFDLPGDAYRSGLARFSDGIFSIQYVTDEPVEIGMMSVAVG